MYCHFIKSAVLSTNVCLRITLAVISSPKISHSALKNHKNFTEGIGNLPEDSQVDGSIAMILLNIAA
jgi:hypothetical protein